MYVISYNANQIYYAFYVTKYRIIGFCTLRFSFYIVGLLHAWNNNQGESDDTLSGRVLEQLSPEYAFHKEFEVKSTCDLQYKRDYV